MLFTIQEADMSTYPFHCKCAALLGFWRDVLNINLLFLTAVLGEGCDLSPPIFLPIFFFKSCTNDCWVKQMRVLQFILLITISSCVFSALYEMFLCVFGIKCACCCIQQCEMTFLEGGTNAKGGDETPCRPLSWADRGQVWLRAPSS